MNLKSKPSLNSTIGVGAATMLAVLLLLLQALFLPIGRTRLPLREVLPQIHADSWWALVLVAALSSVAVAWIWRSAHPPRASYLLTIGTALTPALSWMLFNFDIELGDLVYFLPTPIIVLIVGATLARWIQFGQRIKQLPVALKRCDTAQRLSGRLKRVVGRHYLDANHFLSEDWLSPDGLPTNRPSTLRSSSRSPQWIP